MVFFFGNRCCCGGADPCDLSGCSWVETSFAGVTPETVSVSSLGGAASGSYTITNEIDLTAGNSTPSRKILISCDTVPASGVDTVAAVAWIDRAEFDPSSLCALVLEFCFESKSFEVDIPNGDTVSGICFFVKQGGTVYRTFGIRPSGIWKKRTQADFVVFPDSNFLESHLSGILDSGANPDFSTDGGLIEFGVGVVLRVAAGAADPPSMGARFDNTCIEVNDCPAGGCSPSGADFFLTSDFTIDDDGFGFCYQSYPKVTGTITRTISETAFGYPNQSILVLTEWDSFTTVFGDTADVQSYINLNIAGPGPTGVCKTIDYIDMCWMARGKTWRVSTEYNYLFGSFAAVVFQDGNRYTDSQEEHPSGSSTIPDFSLWAEWGWRVKTWRDGIYDHKIDRYVTNAGASGDPCDLEVFSGSPDFNEPFELGLWVWTRNQHIPSDDFTTGRNEMYLDNISATIVFEACFRGSFSLSLTGVTLSANPVSGCDSSLINTVQTYLDADFVLTKVSGACHWRYSSATYSSGGHQLKFKIELFCTESDECFFVDGYMLLTVESKVGSDPWESSSAVYQISGAFQTPTDSGVFNFDSIANSVDCFNLSGPDSLEVEQVA